MRLFLLFIVLPLMLVALAELIRMKIRAHFKTKELTDWEARLHLEKGRLTAWEGSLLERTAQQPGPPLPPAPVTLFHYQNEPGFLDGVIVESVPHTDTGVTLTLVNEVSTDPATRVWTNAANLRKIGEGLIAVADRLQPVPPATPPPARKHSRSAWSRLRNPDV